MSPPIVSESDLRPRVVAILVGSLAGFIVGEVIAEVLLSLAAQLNHYPGGLHALALATSPPWWANALGLAGLWCGFGLAVYYATQFGRLTPLPRQWQFRPSDLAYVALGVSCQFLVDLLYYPFHLKHLNAPVTHLFGGSRGVTYVLLIVMTTFIAPIIEEWLFRGVLFRSLQSGLEVVAPRAALPGAVIISGCLFALAHGEMLQFVGLALFGMVLALVLRHTQRLVPGIITHMSFNAVAMIGLIAQRAGH